MAAIVTRPGATGGRRAGVALTVALGGLSWLVLVAWDASAWSPYLRHDGLAEGPLPAPVALGVFALGWVVMLSAMMVPTTAPLVGLFAGLTVAAPNRRRLLAGLLAGYGAVWLSAGIAAYAGDVVLHAAVSRWGWLERHEWVVASAVLAGAGAYQLSSLKERCLTRCRNPRAVLLLRWRGRRPDREAFSIGAGHGRECLACCWALMLVMFAVGAGSLGWMLALAALMTAEKVAPWGRRLRRPIGAGLLLAAVLAAL